MIDHACTSSLFLYTKERKRPFQRTKALEKEKGCVKYTTPVLKLLHRQ